MVPMCSLLRKCARLHLQKAYQSEMKISVVVSERIRHGFVKIFPQNESWFIALLQLTLLCGKGRGERILAPRKEPEKPRFQASCNPLIQSGLQNG